MEVSIIFKIAAVGILVSILSQILKHSGREEPVFWWCCSGSFHIYMNYLTASKNCLNSERGKGMDIAKISLLGVCGVMLGFLMKGTRPEYACFITMGIGLVIMGLAVGKVAYLFETMGRIQDMLPSESGYVSTLIRMVGITYIGQFASGICKDAGYGTTAAQIELFCKLSVMILSMPVLLALLETIQDFMI